MVPVPQCPDPCHDFGTVSNLISKWASQTASGTLRARTHGLCRNGPRVGSQQRWPASQQSGSLASIQASPGSGLSLPFWRPLPACPHPWPLLVPSTTHSSRSVSLSILGPQLRPLPTPACEDVVFLFRRNMPLTCPTKPSGEASSVNRAFHLALLCHVWPN